MSAGLVAATIWFGLYVWNPFHTPSWNPSQRVFGLDFFRNPSVSMEPTIPRDDVRVANAWPYLFGSPAVGDIVTFRYPRDPTVQYMKRIVATGGDTVSLSGCVVIRNGVRLTESYILVDGPDSRGWCELDALTVPPAQYFVLGDNRLDSMDSRFWGFLPRGNVFGRVSP